MHGELREKLYEANYSVEELLGDSEISEVYKLKNIQTQDNVVLKVIKGIDSGLYGTIFKREVGALTVLKSCNNIVKFRAKEIMQLSDGSQYGLVYLEYIKGKTLKNIDIVSEFGGKRELYFIIKQIIEAIESAHINGIIHRDINPGNIMIDQDKNVKLIDFGISKVKKMLSQNTLCNFGTPGYSAPESNEGSALEQSDLYSLGAVIYNLQTGECPPVPIEFENVICNASGIDVDLKKVIRKLVKVSLSERYLDIFEVKKDFNKLYDQIAKSNNKYSILIDTDKLNYLKKTYMLKDIKYSELVNEDLKSEFGDAYIFMNSSTNENPLW